MGDIGLFYATGTGQTLRVAQMIRAELGDRVDLHDIGKSFADQFANYDRLILGTSTWNAGDLADDWEIFLSDFKQIDFSGKKVALFALGDQVGYSDTFVNSLARLYEAVKDSGATVVGFWPTDGYDASGSEAVEGVHFYGLVIDQENQPELTAERVKRWSAQIRSEFA